MGKANSRILRVGKIRFDPWGPLLTNEIVCVGTGGGSRDATHFFEKRVVKARQKRSPKFGLGSTFCARVYSGEARKRSSPPGRRKAVVRTARVAGHLPIGGK